MGHFVFKYNLFVLVHLANHLFKPLIIFAYHVWNRYFFISCFRREMLFYCLSVHLILFFYAFFILILKEWWMNKLTIILVNQMKKILHLAMLYTLKILDTLSIWILRKQSNIDFLITEVNSLSKFRNSNYFSNKVKIHHSN